MKPHYSIGGEVQCVKGWAYAWGIDYFKAYTRLLTMCRNKEAVPVWPKPRIHPPAGNPRPV